MLILTLNTGSSSLKFQLIDTKTKKWLYKGIVDGLATKQSFFEAYTNTKKINFKTPIETIEEAVELALEILFQKKLFGRQKLTAVAHRVVHGGKKLNEPTLITPKTLKQIEQLSELAPLHNPYNLAGIHAAQKILKPFPHIAVFDTGFYKTLPEKAFRYAIPLDLAKKFHIQKYGFHGISHEYVTQETLKLLKKTPNTNTKIITCHLGNGCSITASINGKAIDTSMGFTPLEGVPMGTRSGDLDPAVLPYLAKKTKKSADEILQILNHESGLKCLAGTNDMRDIYRLAKKKNKKALLALELFCYRIAKYIGAFSASLSGIRTFKARHDSIDALTFTGGIGENAHYVRTMICNYLSFLGLKLDQQKNLKNAPEIHTKKSTVKIFVIPTNEELMMAEKTASLVEITPLN